MYSSTPRHNPAESSLGAMSHPKQWGGLAQGHQLVRLFPAARQDGQLRVPCHVHGPADVYGQLVFPLTENILASPHSNSMKASSVSPSLIWLRYTSA